MGKRRSILSWYAQVAGRRTRCSKIGLYRRFSPEQRRCAGRAAAAAMWLQDRSRASSVLSQLRQAVQAPCRQQRRWSRRRWRQRRWSRWPYIKFEDLRVKAWLVFSLCTCIDTEDVVSVRGEEIAVTLEILPLAVAERHVGWLSVCVCVCLIKLQEKEKRAGSSQQGKSNIHAHPNSSTIFTRHCAPHFLIAPSAMNPVTMLQSPRIVMSHPLPMALMIGSAIMAPVKEQMLRTKLFRAMPDAARLGMNSVSMVDTSEKISMEPTPKKTMKRQYEKDGKVILSTYNLQSLGISTAHPSLQSNHTISTKQAREWLPSTHSPACDPQV